MREPATATRASGCSPTAPRRSIRACRSRSRAHCARSPHDVIVASDPYVGVAARTGRSLARSRRKADRRGARRSADVHARLRVVRAGGSSRRRPTPSRDRGSATPTRLARSPRFTSSLVAEVTGHPATACFPTYSDLAAFRDPPLVPVPEARRVVFVGALEAYKNVDGLAAAWRRVARTMSRRGAHDRRPWLATRGDRPARCGSPGPGRAPPRAAARRGRGADRLCAGARAPVVPGGPRARRARGVRARTDGRRDERRRNPRHGDRRRRRDLDPARRHRCARRGAACGCSRIGSSPFVSAPRPA